MLLRDIERHLRKTGTAPSRFGIRVANDPRLVSDLRRGREPGPRMTARVRAFIASEDAR